MKTTLRLISLIGLFVLAFPVFPVSSEPLKIGVAPTNGEDSVTLAKFWIPFLEKLETKSNIQLRFATAPDLLEFNQRLARGEYDLVITDQYLFTIFRQKHQLSYLAELSTEGESPEMGLVTASDIVNVKQLEGSLLAVKGDENPANVKALDQYLTRNGVTARRDNLLSYTKILQSISEKLHIAGLVPVNKVNQGTEQYSILWRTHNRNSYVITAPSGMSPVTLEKLTTALHTLFTDSDVEKQPSHSPILVLAVRSKLVD